MKKSLKDHDDTGYVDAMPEEHIRMVWERIKAAWSFVDPILTLNSHYKDML